MCVDDKEKIDADCEADQAEEREPAEEPGHDAFVFGPCVFVAFGHDFKGARFGGFCQVAFDHFESVFVFVDEVGVALVEVAEAIISQKIEFAETARGFVGFSTFAATMECAAGCFEWSSFVTACVMVMLTSDYEQRLF